MATYQRSKLGRFMMIGGLFGAAISLFDRGTRESVRRGMGATANGGRKLFQTIKTNPSNVTDYVKNTANNVKMTAQEVTQDVIQMADKVNGANKSSRQAYKYVMEAGNEISEITQKIRHSGQGFALGGGTNQLPSTMGSATSTQSSTTSSKGTSTSGFSPSSAAKSSTVTTGSYTPTSSTKTANVSSTKNGSTTPTVSTSTSNMNTTSSVGPSSNKTTSTKTTTTDSKKETTTDHDY